MDQCQRPAARHWLGRGGQEALQEDTHSASLSGFLVISGTVTVGDLPSPVHVYLALLVFSL